MASSRILLHFPPFRTLLKTWGSSGKLLEELALVLALVKLEVVHLFMVRLGMLGKLAGVGSGVVSSVASMSMIAKGGVLWST